MSPLAPLLALAATLGADGGQTGTSTSALEEPPLSEEDLALLDDLNQAEAGAQNVRPSWPRIYRSISEEILPRSTARSTGQLLEQQVGLASVRRSFPLGESVVLRGRNGRRVALTLDGVPLDTALDSIDGAQLLGSVDPWQLHAAWIHPGGTLLGPARGAAGGVHLSTEPPKREPGVAASAELSGWTADRSARANLALDGSLGPAAGRVTGRLYDASTLRLGDGSELSASEHRGGSGSMRGRLFGEQDDEVEIRFGIDFDRLTATAPLAWDLARARSARDRLMAFGQASFGDEHLGGEVLLGGHRFEARRLEGDGEERADTFHGSFSLRAEILQGVLFVGGADLTSSEARASALEGQRFEGGAVGGLVLETKPLATTLLFRLYHGVANASGDDPAGLGERRAESSRLLTEGRAELELVSPLSVYARWSQSVHLPGPVDLARAEEALAPEQVLTVEGGPVLEGEKGRLSAAVFASRVDQPIERDASGALSNRERLLLWGAEGRGSLELLEGLELVVAASLSESSADAPLLGLPWIEVQGALRYVFSARDAFVEAAVALAEAHGDRHPLDEALVGEPSYVVASLRAGSDLGLGFRLLLALENALDADIRPLGSALAEPGIDLSLGLLYELR